MKSDVIYLTQKSKVYSLMYSSMFKTLREQYAGKAIKHKKLGFLTMKDFSFSAIPQVYCTDDDGRSNIWSITEIDDTKLENILLFVVSVINNFSVINEVLRKKYTKVAVEYNSKIYLIEHYFVLDDCVSLIEPGDIDQYNPRSFRVKIDEIIFL